MGTDLNEGGIRIDHRRVVGGAIPQLRRTEPFQSSSAESSRTLVDDLLVTIAAIADGVEHNLPPDQVVANQDVRRAIARYAGVYRKRGLPPTGVIHAYQILRQTALLSLESQSKQVKCSGTDAFALARQLSALFDRVTRAALEDYS